MKKIEFSIPSVDLPKMLANGIGIVKTDWIFYKDKDGDLTVNDTNTNIIHKSIGDTVNLIKYEATLGLADDEVCFLKTNIWLERIVDGGDNEPYVTPKSSKLMVVSNNQKGFKFSGTMVVTPEIILDFEPMDAPLYSFNIKTSKFQLYSGSGQHKSTSYTIIRVSDNKAVFERERDEENLTSINIPEGLLEINKQYIINVQHHTDTNSNSNIGGKVICT